MSGAGLDPARWGPRLEDLAERVRRAVRAAQRDALAAGDLERLSRTVGRGHADVTFGIDVAAEAAVEAWLDEAAREGPISLFTEDAGWRHRGPGPDGAPVDLPGFDHGGPRGIIDPIDGTRVIMGDLRSAWTVIGLAGPGPGQPRLAEVTLGLLGELPDSRAAVARVLLGGPAGCELLVREVADGAVVRRGPHRTDDDDRVDRGHFIVFRYGHAQRVALAELETRLAARLQEREGADLGAWYDDQYASSAGLIALVALGHYRFVLDARGWLEARGGPPAIPCHPYDIAGAVVCARAAGCAVLDPDGRPLDFPLDGETPVSFAVHANFPTAARLGPHLAAALTPPPGRTRDARGAT